MDMRYEGLGKEFLTFSVDSRCCLGYHRCWNMDYYKSAASHTEKAHPMKKDDVRVTVCLSILEGLWQ